jgi:hypothetical protein
MDMAGTIALSVYHWFAAHPWELSALPIAFVLAWISDL